VTCIEIEGLIQVQSDLPMIDNSEWSNSNREVSGLTIFGDPGDGVADTVDGGGLYRGFSMHIDASGPLISHDAQLNISDVTLSNFRDAESDPGGSGGAALNVNLAGQYHDLRIQLSGVEVHNNSSDDTYGGALYANSTNRSSSVPSLHLDIVDSTFTGNSGGTGGAFYAYSVDDSVVVNLESSTFTGNEARVWGGGAAFAKSFYGYTRVGVSGAGYFAGNESTGPGGAVYGSGTVDVAGEIADPVVFSDDTAGWGGAVYAKQGGSITGAIFENNSGGAGGAVYTYGDLTVSDATFRGNRATGNHGGAIVVNADAELNRTAIVGNYARYNGGGIASYNLQVDNSFIGGNEAGDVGGAIYLPRTMAGAGLLELNFSTVYDDTVTLEARGPAEIQAKDIRATMSVVGNSTTGYIWQIAGSLDDTTSVSTSDDTLFAGSGSGNAAPGSLDLGSLTGSVPGTLGRAPSADSILALPVSLLGFAPGVNPLPSVTTDQLGVSRAAPFTIGARQLVAPNPPSPPAPSTTAGPPRDVRALPGVESADVAWLAPSSSGSFPVTSYQVTASPGGRGCLVSAPTLTCTITGLTPGESYTFVVKALNGAGWSSPSTPSEAVVPVARETKVILITSSRDRITPSIVRVDGSTTGLVGAEVTPYIRKAGQTSYSAGSNVRTVDAQGRFTWQRKSGKKFSVYFTSGDVRSNRLIIVPREA
jgi:hypothetical protein